MSTFDVVVPASSMPGVVQSSRANCHARGLHSIVIAPRLRIFYAAPDHELYRNGPGFSFSVGLHPHHCSLTLIRLMGKPRNIVEGAFPRLSLRMKLLEFRYASPLRDNERGSFSATGRSRTFSLVSHPISHNEMDAHDLHTVFVPRGEEAAWAVVEGDEDPNYVPLTYSNDNLEDFDFDGMYQPVDEAFVRQTLARVGVPVVDGAFDRWRLP